MSCSVKISGKAWANSQRRIGSLPEETSAVYPTQVTSSSNNIVASVSTPTLVLNQQQQQHQLIKLGQTSRASSSKSIAAKKGEDTSKLLKYIDDNVIGKNGTFFGPFGRRKVVYCDYTASGRSLQFLEEYIVKEVLPCLGDTRASTSICSLQSSLFRHEARDIVRHAVGAGEQDAVLFTGHGTDDALRTLLRHLDLPQRQPTVVFVGPFEHHANLRPWREHGSKVVRITETKEGFLDLNDLERKLNEEQTSNAVMVGCFNAASCITGVLADDVATTLMLHQYGALSVWDYTSAAPFVQIDMNPHLPGVDETAVHKDAIIFSGHKFMGGAQSPGVLVAKKSLLNNNIINDDMRDSHRYLHDPELRDESGTAGVVESIRCGLAVQLKESVTPQAIVARQDKICKQVLAHVRTIPELILIGSGSNNLKRLPIFSFMVRHPRGTFLHHNFVCAILNDVFGIQARGGCACAGRYAHDLMGIDIDLARKYESVLMARDSKLDREESNAEVLRPGFARLSLPYFMSESELAFVLEALKMVATEGWKLLPQYVLNPDTGEWRHHTNSVFKERKWLGSVRYTDGKMTASERRVSGAGSGVFPQSYSDCLQTARNIFNRARKMAHRYPLQIDRNVTFSIRGEALRWFILPGEAQDLLLGNSHNVKQDLPFDPSTWKNLRRIINEFNSTNIISNQNNNSSNIAIRRLNSDIPQSGNSPLFAIGSPRHHSLPALSIDPSNSTIDRRSEYTSDCHTPLTKQHSDEIQSTQSTKVYEKNFPFIGPSSEISDNIYSTPPVKFALGEAVTSSMILGTTPAGARLMAGEHSMPGDSGINKLGRTRCNSLGSANSAKTPPLPIPLSPQTLASLGVANTQKMSSSLAASRNIRHCSCNSHNELSRSLELDGSSPTRSSPSSVTSSPNSSSSPSPHPYIYSSHHHQNHQLHHHHHHHHGIGHVDAPKLGRCSPILSSFSQSSEDDLRAYLKEVTKELATEIKSEIREVISKVDDVLSESNSVDTPQHHSYRTSSTSSNSEKNHQRDDSFSASEIAEYLMEFSKEMASEVKSEIRCMVNQVDGLGRFSPDLQSTNSTCSTGYGTPERRLPSSPQAGHELSKLTKMNNVQQQHESKMSSDCSSDETVIYVVGPKIITTTTTTPAKTIEMSKRERAKTSDEEEENEKILAKNIIEKSTTSTKILPEIYSTVNSVSSQDSGINLSFNESDIRPMDLGRTSSSSSSSGGSSSAESYGIINNCRRVRSLSGTIKRREKDEKLPDELSEDDDNDETMMTMMKEKIVPDVLSSDDEDETINITETERKTLITTKLSNSFGPQWHSPTKNIWKPSVEAIQEFDMIKDKDRVLICIPASSMGIGMATGGYSLALIHTLHQYQFYARSKSIDFEIGAVTIDASSSYNQIKSMDYFKRLQIPYFYEEAEEQALLIDSNQIIADCTQFSPADYSMKTCNVCGHCGTNTRKRLYAVAKRYGYNVLALGQHLDDFAEGFFSSLFYTGKLKTMKAHYYDKEHDLRVVRPFVYVRERVLKQFTLEKQLPMLRNICVTCEEAVTLKTQKNKELMVQQEKNYPRLYWSMRTALRPLILARGNFHFASGHQRIRHKLKARTSPSHPMINVLATPKELGGCESDTEQII